MTKTNVVLLVVDLIETIDVLQSNQMHHEKPRLMSRLIRNYSENNI